MTFPRSTLHPSTGSIKRKGFLKPTKKRRKKTPLRKLKIELEKLQKQIVIKKYGKNCFTCPQTNLTGSNCQLGHSPWPRSVLSTECKYSVDFCRIQCFLCNIHRGGMGAVAYATMIAAGIDVDAMWKLNLETKGKTYNTKWFEAKIAEYQALI